MPKNDKNEVTVSGVRYQIPKQDYDMFNEILAPDTPVVKEQMTDAVMKRVLGPYYGRVVIYDNENNELLTKTYHGQTVHWNALFTKCATQNTEIFNAKLSGLKVVRTLSMQIADMDFPGFAKWTQGGKKLTPTENGCSIVCNYVVLNEKTGRYELLRPDSWLGVWDYKYHPDDVARVGPSQVPFRTSRDRVFRLAVIAAGRIR